MLGGIFTTSKSSVTDKALENKYEEWKKQAIGKAEDVIWSTLPKKILELSDLIRTTMEPSSPYQHLATDSTIYPSPIVSNEEPDSKKRRLTQDNVVSVSGGAGGAPFTGLVLTNSHINELQERVKKEAEELVGLCDDIKIWLTFAMPKIEDGDNFGVQVQEAVLTELFRAQDSSVNIRIQADNSNTLRAKICSKLIKYPFIEDYAVALREFDKRQLYATRYSLTEIQLLYVVLTDSLHKNIQKLRVPKGNNSAGLY